MYYGWPQDNESYVSVTEWSLRAYRNTLSYELTRFSRKISWRI